MSQLHEIKHHIDSVNGTKKITRAMYLISASKSQKARTQLENSFPHFQQIYVTMGEILTHTRAVHTPFVEMYDVKRDAGCLYLVLAGDKGMAGGYNHNIYNLMEQNVDKEKDDLLVAGFLGRNQIMQQGYRVDPGFRLPVMNPSIYRARDVAELVVEKFLTRRYLSVQLIYTEMENALKQVPTMIQLLPLDVHKLAQTMPAGEKHDVIRYEPSAEDVFDHLVPHYLKGVIYGAFVEAFSSEQHARMYAMDGATKSANDTIDNLSVRYNRARQSAITQELTEIIGGIPEE